MQLNLDQELSDINGQVLINEHQKPVTLKQVCLEPLKIDIQTEKPAPSGEEKFTRWELALRINKGGTQAFTPEEVSLMKKLIGLCYPPYILGPAFKLLNQ